MENPPVIVSAPSRLHFGLFSIGQTIPRRYGGVGMMVQQPTTRIEVARHSDWSAEGPDSAWTLKLAKRWFDLYRPLLEHHDRQTRIKIKTQSAGNRHVGLGSGTQHSMAIATALFRLFELPLPPVSEMAQAMGRAGRSAIGSYGFRRGGFLIDRGMAEGDDIAPLDLQIEFPDEWPVLLVIP